MKDILPTYYSRRNDKNMTKADIVEQIQSTTCLCKSNSFDMLEATLSILKEAFEAGEKIKIAGFGNFEIKQKKDRKGRNPQNGESITIQARRVLTFKPSMVLRKAINGTAE